MPAKGNANLDQFLTPEAMLTPGVAGSMCMMIGNALHYNFAVPNGWSILALSFVCGLLVLANNKSMVTKGVLYVLNSLVIFCVAAGTATLSADSNPSSSHSEWYLLTWPAYAQPATDALQADYNRLSAQSAALEIKINAARGSAAASADIARMTQDRAEIDRKRADLLRAIVNAEAKSKGQAADSHKERTFFSPLKF